MRRLAALSTIIVGIAGSALVHASPARPAGGCSVASAPVIASGATQTSNPKACPDRRQYWAMNLKIGDTLNVDIGPTAPGNYEFQLYGPDVGTIGNSLCGNAYASPAKLSCLIPAAGRYVLVTTGSGSFTPAAKSVPAQAGRAAGSCDPANAPTAPSGVTQYANTRLCLPGRDAQYWKIDLGRGDTMNVNVLPFGGSIDVQVYGPNVGAIGKPICGNGFASPATVSCRIAKAGRYVLGVSHAGSFAPLVFHPTRTVVTAPRFVKGGGAIPIRAAIRSNAPNPTGTCTVQEQQSGGRWAAAARVHTTNGTCRARLVLRRRGTVRLRVHFKGARGWASSTSKPFSVVVR